MGLFKPWVGINLISMGMVGYLTKSMQACSQAVNTNLITGAGGCSMNHYNCSDGRKLTAGTIKSYLNKAYHKKYRGEPYPRCEGCGDEAQCSAHIIAQARCKQLGKTELIWNPSNFFPSCYLCNRAIENPKGKAWRELRNIQTCLEFIKQHDPELYTKFV